MSDYRDAQSFTASINDYVGEGIMSFRDARRLMNLVQDLRDMAEDGKTAMDFIAGAPEAGKSHGRISIDMAHGRISADMGSGLYIQVCNSETRGVLVDVVLEVDGEPIAGYEMKDHLDLWGYLVGEGGNFEEENGND